VYQLAIGVSSFTSQGRLAAAVMREGATGMAAVLTWFAGTW
jgi:hypothetical protein